MQKISPYELSLNPFQAIGKQWAMVTSWDGHRVNTMTASWGGVGVLWNKPVAYVFLRPQRYTRELVDQNGLFSVCFLPEEYRSKLSYCGAHTGRDGDKLEACGFEAMMLDDAPVLMQAETAFTLRKLYRQQLAPGCFTEHDAIEKWYPDGDFHYMYVAEILGAYQK